MNKLAKIIEREIEILESSLQDQLDKFQKALKEGNLAYEMAWSQDAFAMAAKTKIFKGWLSIIEEKTAEEVIEYLQRELLEAARKFAGSTGKLHNLIEDYERVALHALYETVRVNVKNCS